MTQDVKVLDYLRRVTAELRAAREQLRTLDDERHAPIAIVGIGCRFPGDVRSPDQLWDLILAERDAIGPFPADRGWDLDRTASLDPAGTGARRVREGHQAVAPRFRHTFEPFAKRRWRNAGGFGQPVGARPLLDDELQPRRESGLVRAGSRYTGLWPIRSARTHFRPPDREVSNTFHPGLVRTSSLNAKQAGTLHLIL